MNAALTLESERKKGQGMRKSAEGESHEDFSQRERESLILQEEGTEWTPASDSLSEIVKPKQ